MSDFKGRHFEGEIVLWAVRWYCRYGVSCRAVEQMMGERSVSVDHSTIYGWYKVCAQDGETAALAVAQAELNAAIRALVADINDRPMRGWGTARRALFEQFDQPALLPSPSAAYEYADWKRCRVSLDYHVEVGRHSTRCRSS